MYNTNSWEEQSWCFTKLTNDSFKDGSCYFVSKYRWKFKREILAQAIRGSLLIQALAASLISNSTLITKTEAILDFLQQSSGLIEQEVVILKEALSQKRGQMELLKALDCEEEESPI